MNKTKVLFLLTFSALVFSCSDNKEKLLPIKGSIRGEEITYYDASLFFKYLLKRIEENSTKEKRGFSADINFFMKGEESPIKWKSIKSKEYDLAFKGEIALGDKDGVFTTTDPDGNLVANLLAINMYGTYESHAFSALEEISFGSYDRSGGSKLMSSISNLLIESCKEIHLVDEFDRGTINNISDFDQIGFFTGEGYIITKGGVTLKIKYSLDGGSGGSTISLGILSESVETNSSNTSESANQTNSPKEDKYGEVKDIDGNSYKTVRIGDQVWMAENLNVRTFRNGDPIPEAKRQGEWEYAAEYKKPASCYYDNNPENGVKYGRLYNWYAATDSRGLAPNGWHVPSDAEWKKLIHYLRGDGASIRSTTGWDNSNGQCTNESGFSALPGGIRHIESSFRKIGDLAYWWSSAERNPDDLSKSCSYMLSGAIVALERGYAGQNWGCSVRCLRDTNYSINIENADNNN